jgi:hypothetical protein
VSASLAGLYVEAGDRPWTERRPGVILEGTLGGHPAPARNGDDAKFEFVI